MKVAFISNFYDTCGISIYGENLIKYFPEDIEFHVIPPSNMEYALEQASDCDLVHINFHEGTGYGFSIPEFLDKIHLPAILTNHTTTYEANWFEKVDILVTHIPHPNFGKKNRVVGQPILDLEFNQNPPQKMVLTQAGFPFPWKNYPKICEAAMNLKDMGCEPELLFFMPDTYHYNTQLEIDKCKKIVDDIIPATYITEWIDDISLVTRMHNEASVAVYYTEEKREGPSASVRLGIAAKIPVVVNGSAYQYQDIVGEPGIFAAYDGERELVRTIEEAYHSKKYAADLISRQNYSTVGSQYYEIYKEVLDERSRITAISSSRS